ncbi:MAG: hypothetical protein J3K34DRAFT_177801 [Monoraphidium minutum]|nr:MAG: hypothetical protein J3K34DRAFT_177801 [Monoraphidium minutum]
METASHCTADTRSIQAHTRALMAPRLKQKPNPCRATTRRAQLTRHPSSPSPSLSPPPAPSSPLLHAPPPPPPSAPPAPRGRRPLNSRRSSSGDTGAAPRSGPRPRASRLRCITRCASGGTGARSAWVGPHSLIVSSMPGGGAGEGQRLGRSSE